MFEQLWEEAESLFKNDESKTSEVLSEIINKLSVYQSLDKMDKMSKEDKKQAKLAILGTILLSMTHLTLIDDLNSFAALQHAVQSLKKEQEL